MELREMIQTYWSAALAEQRRSAAKDGTMLKPREPPAPDVFLVEVDAVLAECRERLVGSNFWLLCRIDKLREEIKGRAQAPEERTGAE